MVQAVRQESNPFIAPGTEVWVKPPPEPGATANFGEIQEARNQSDAQAAKDEKLAAISFGVATAALTLGLAQASAAVTAAGSAGALPEPVTVAQGLPEAVTPITAPAAALPAPALEAVAAPTYSSLVEVAAPSSLISAPSLGSVVAGAGIVKEVTKTEENVSFLSDIGGFIKDASESVANVAESPLLSSAGKAAGIIPNPTPQQQANAQVTNPSVQGFIPNQDPVSISSQYLLEKIYGEVADDPTDNKFATVANQQGGQMNMLYIGLGFLALLFLMKKR